MFGKNEDASIQEVDEIIQKFNLQNLTQNEKDMLVSMAKDRILVSLSPNGIQQASFEKTLIYQNWMALGHLCNIEQELQRIINMSK